MDKKYTGYLDKYGMVTVNSVPREPYADNSENGLLFTAQAMYALKQNDLPQEFNFKQLFNDCFIDGVLYRSAEPHPKPDSHDNYTAVALGSLFEKNTESPRKLLWSLIKHFGVVKGEIFLRFPQVWLLLIGAAFPILRWLLLPAMYILYMTVQPNQKNDGGDIQLKLTITAYLDILYPELNLFEKWKSNLCKHLYVYLEEYYGDHHPNSTIWREGK